MTASASPLVAAPTGTRPWQPLDCDASGVHERGNNLALVPGLRGDGQEIVARVVSSFSDVLGAQQTSIWNSEGPRKGEVRRWTTSLGEVSALVREAKERLDFDRRPGGFVDLVYTVDRAIEPADVVDLLVHLGADRARLDVQGEGQDSWYRFNNTGSIWQRWSNATLVNWENNGGAFLQATASWRDVDGRTVLTLRRAYIFGAADGLLAATEDLAEQFLRCTYRLGPESNTTAGFVGLTEAEGSLATVVLVNHSHPPAHCGSWTGNYVIVDAVTKAVLAYRLSNPCI
jgi:hypothetical protein